MYLIEDGKLKFIDPRVSYPTLKEELDSKKLIKISLYMESIYLPKKYNKNIIINLDKKYKFNELYTKILLFLQDINDLKIPFWYKKTDWYMIMDQEYATVNICFISLYSDDRFSISIVKNKGSYILENDINHDDLLDFSININFRSGHINNYIFFVNEFDKVFNNERYLREGELLEKQKNQNIEIWKLFWNIDVETKFDIALTYITFLYPEDRLFAIFVFITLAKLDVEAFIKLLLKYKFVIAFIFNSLSIPFENFICIKLVEKTLCLLNIICDNEYMFISLLNHNETMIFLNKLSSDNKISKELCIIRREAIKLLNKKKYIICPTTYKEHK